MYQQLNTRQTRMQTRIHLYKSYNITHRRAHAFRSTTNPRCDTNN